MYIVAILSKASENKTNETEVVDWIKSNNAPFAFEIVFFLDQLVNNQTPLEKFWYYWQSRKLGQPV